jgi:hypothetical protein
MPIGDPKYYKPLAQYILRSDGSVTDQAGNLLSPAGASFYNFSHGSGGWSVSGDSPLPPSAVYFIEGDLDMTGRGQFNATMLVTGSVNLRGTGSGWTLGAAMANIVFVTGGDFKINGNGFVVGTILANEQVSMNGNATVEGSLIALDSANNHTLVEVTSEFSDDFSGSAVVRYEGGRSTFLQVSQDSVDLKFTRRIK